MQKMKASVILAMLAWLALASATDFFGGQMGSSSSSSVFQTSSLTDEDRKCFCQLEGNIDDCLCSVDTVDYFNNMKIFPRLQSLLHKPYFRYFQYNADKKCPFWDNRSDKCASMSCGVRSCRPDEIPPGLKVVIVEDDMEEDHSYENKYTEEAQKSSSCEKENDGMRVDDSLSPSTQLDLMNWRDHDDSLTSFCDVDAEQCPGCSYVDLTINPERYTGYSGEPARKIWRAIYEENCFKPPNSSSAHSFSQAFLQASLEKMCLEKRAFYRAVSGLHASITIHLSANYPKKSTLPFSTANVYEPNLDEFQQRFDPVKTNGQGPYWLKNLYFVYLLELRAIVKVAPYLEGQVFYTGKPEEDKETQIAMKELLNLVRSFPDQFDESAMFAANGLGVDLREEFRTHFLNISRVMDCVSCDKCKLWGKLQVTGLGTALKILFAEDSKGISPEAMAEELQTLNPPPLLYPPGSVSPDFKLTRNEIVALFNAFGRISTSINQLEKFRQMLPG